MDRNKIGRNTLGASWRWMVAYTKLHRKHKKALFNTVSVALTM
jgi:hypothetical protein